MAARKLKGKIKVNAEEAIQSEESAGQVDAQEELDSTEAKDSETKEAASDDAEADSGKTDEGAEDSSNGQRDDIKVKAEEEKPVDFQDKYLRAVAELENARKRHARDRSDLIKYAGESLARDLLEVLDGFDLALKQDNKGSLEEFVKGMTIIQGQLRGIFERHSIKPESLLGKQFDPNKADAIALMPSDEIDEGVVMEEFKKAYHFKDKLLREGQVVVSKGPAEVSADSEDEEKIGSDEGSAGENENGSEACDA